MKHVPDIIRQTAAMIYRLLIAFILVMLPAIMLPAAEHVYSNVARQDSMLENAIVLSEEHRYQESLNILSQLQSLAEQNGNTELLFKAHMNTGINMAMMSAYDDALRSFATAYKIAVDRLDLKHETGVINNIACVYMQMGNNSLANEYYKKNYRKALEMNDSALTAGSAMNIAMTALNLDKPDECLKYMRIAEPLAEQSSHNRHVFLLLKLTYLLYKGNNRQTIELCHNELQNSLPHEVRRNIRCKLATAFIATGMYREAIDTLTNALADESDETAKIPLYNLMRQAYRQSGNPYLALQYTDSLMNAKDSMQARRDQTVYENNNIRIDLMRKDKEMADIQARENRNRLFMWSAIIIFILLILTLVNYIKRIRQKQNVAKQELELSRQNQELLKNKLQQKETETLLKHKELQIEIEKKNRELMTKAMAMANKNELLQEIIDCLTEDVRIEHNSQLDKIIRRLRSQLNENKEWDNFNIYFQQTNNEFIVNLRNRHPNLTANEIRFISLLYIGLSNKEISSLLNITDEYCKKKRKAVAQKMQLTSPRELSDYIATM